MGSSPTIGIFLGSTPNIGDEAWFKIPLKPDEMGRCSYESTKKRLETTAFRGVLRKMGFVIQDPTIPERGSPRPGVPQEDKFIAVTTKIPFL